jgi:hypothetical protein
VQGRLAFNAFAESVHQVDDVALPFGIQFLVGGVGDFAGLALFVDEGAQGGCVSASASFFADYPNKPRS